VVAGVVQLYLSVVAGGARLWLQGWFYKVSAWLQARIKVVTT